MNHESSSEDDWRPFIELCTHFKEKEELKELFDLFFTFEEKEDVAKRFSILKALLDESLTQREMAEKLGVSISKITRGSNALKTTSHQLKEVLKEKMV
jgi:TrpR family transcriptional regulator, trp operon repressor